MATRLEEVKDKEVAHNHQQHKNVLASDSSAILKEVSSPNGSKPKPVRLLHQW